MRLLGAFWKFTKAVFNYYWFSVSKKTPADWRVILGCVVAAMFLWFIEVLSTSHERRETAILLIAEAKGQPTEIQVPVEMKATGWVYFKLWGINNRPNFVFKPRRVGLHKLSNAELHTLCVSQWKGLQNIQVLTDSVFVQAKSVAKQ